MPRYSYKCSSCEFEQIIFHSISEEIDFCTNCENVGTMIKLLTTPVYKKKTNKSQVGEMTREYIEMNREVLEQEKENAKRETYEPT